MNKYIDYFGSAIIGVIAVMIFVHGGFITTSFEYIVVYFLAQISSFVWNTRCSE